MGDIVDFNKIDKTISIEESLEDVVPMEWGQIHRNVLAEQGFTNEDQYLPELLKNEEIPYRLWITSSVHGDILIYHDLGNGWCIIELDSRKIERGE